MAFIPALLTSISTIVGARQAIALPRQAAKRAKGQAEQAERIRAQERAAITKAPPTKSVVSAVKEPPTIERAEALREVAKKEAAAIAAGRKRRRTTLVTGPRGLLEEPVVRKPALLGA